MMRNTETLEKVRGLSDLEVGNHIRVVVVVVGVIFPAPEGECARLQYFFGFPVCMKVI